MKTVLITGANKSIGFETARQLLQNGFHVFLGSRSIDKGQQAVAHLKAEGFEQVEAIQLDVSSQASVDAARAEIGERTAVLDVLINNAGISGGQPQAALSVTAERFNQVLDTNLYGVLRVTQAFIDLLRNAPAPRIVNVSSGQGSLTVASDPQSKYYQFKGALYQTSKAALNMYTIQLAYELRDTPFKVNAVCPGFTRTDFNQQRGTGTVEDAGKRVVKYAMIDENGPTGKYFCEELFPATGECPW
jgi:NAD(P)-dependent dehydrogenase (short-subunit alcohol dehydrogenase family)